MEHIPDYLFDLLNQKDFDELTSEEHSIVLSIMDKDTYSSMRAASHAARQFLEDEYPVFIPSNQLDQILKEVERKKMDEPTIVWNRPIALWKAAALFLLLGGGWLVFVLTNKNTVIQTSYITKLDTVFVEKEIPGEKIHDTVYIEYERKQKRNLEHLPIDNSSLPKQEINIPTMNDINIIGIKEKDKPVNNAKGNSIKDDSLIQSFKFVTL
jgi:hypothetical protein